TMCAGIIARELNMELFRIDLSRIVSKYIGETEKHLAEVFDEAERAQAIILFDEADSLFGKRTDVKSSVDRYANLEVNYLLQRVESYEGVTILTTNFESGLDEAFKRRLSFRITFPFPDREMRLRLWRTMIPARAEVADDIDFAWLAGYEMAGGHIKNVLLRSAFLAAEADTPISGAILEEAVAKEFAEMGKLLQRG
ncbi:MAG: ATP-binding protein, partial [Deltaproteobacteria bacterium]|nr:ATP-binding protein [Deltaproteobacteria bacterium]